MPCEHEKSCGPCSAQSDYPLLPNDLTRITHWPCDLHADRTSTHELGSNQLRLWFSALAYLLLERMRALGLHGTELARASVGTIRLRLLKIAGQVSVSVRRVHVRMASSSPMQALFALCQRRLAALDPPPA